MRIVQPKEYPLKTNPRPTVGSNKVTNVGLVVMHCTAGNNVTGAIDTLRANGLAYHYLISNGKDRTGRYKDEDGLIYKLCPLSERASHAGNSYGPREAGRGVSRLQDRHGNFLASPTPSVNDYSIGISFVNIDDGSVPITEAQYNAAVELIKSINGTKAKSFTFNLEYVTSHAKVSPIRKVDPVDFDMQQFAKDVNLPYWYWGMNS